VKNWLPVSHKCCLKKKCCLCCDKMLSCCDKMLSLRLRALSDWASGLSNAYRRWLHSWRRAESIGNQWLWLGGKHSLVRFTNVLCQTASALTQATCRLRWRNLTTEVSLWLTTIAYQIFSFHTMLQEFENAEIYHRSFSESSVFKMFPVHT